MIKVTRLTFIPASRPEANAVAALSGPGEDLGFQTCVPMLGWGTEIAAISCGDKNDELCFRTFSTMLLVQHRGLPVMDVLL